jgi:uncharacterized protein YaeQ
MDRHVYQDLQLTLARHPSETDERMMVRLLAYCLHYAEGMQFTKGLSSDEEPDLWVKTLSDEIDLWVDLGQSDEKRIRKACGRAKQVLVYSYGGKATGPWWQQLEDKLKRFSNLTVIEIDKEQSQLMAPLAQRAMVLQCTVQDGQIWLCDADNAIFIEPKNLMV